jgi:hypothetical protein
VTVSNFEMHATVADNAALEARGGAEAAESRKAKVLFQEGN